MSRLRGHRRESDAGKSRARLRCGVVAQGRAAGRDRFVEHRLDRRDQLGALASARRSFASVAAERFGENRAKQRLADIDIAEAGNHALIEQRRLERRLLALAGARQTGVEFIASGSRPIRRSSGSCSSGRRSSTDRIETEAARIVQVTTAPRGHMEHDVVVRLMRRS